MNDPMPTIGNILYGRPALKREPSPEYLDALHTLQGLPDTGYMVVDGREQLAVPITSAADAIAEDFVRRADA